MHHNFLLHKIITSGSRDFYKGKYIGANWKVYEHCFMKQKCQVQMAIAQYKNEENPMITGGIYTTHQHFQMRYVTLFLLKALKSYQLK